MKLINLLTIFIFTSILSIDSLAADTFLDSKSFSVTFNLSQEHYLTVSDLDFRINPGMQMEDEFTPIESTTGRIVAYSNSPSGHSAIIVASDNIFLSDDGYSFLMRGSYNDNPFVIPFILNSSFNPDGSIAPNGVRQIFPGDVIIDVDGSPENHRVVRDLWATLIYNSDISEVPPDYYKASLTLIQFSTDNLFGE